MTERTDVTSRRSPRVAMLVLNPCHNDARVLRAARSLSDCGAQVRVFALGNSSFPQEVVMVAGVEVHRLEVRSWLHVGLGAMRMGYLALHGRLTVSPVQRLRPVGSRTRVRALRLLLAPLLAVLVLLPRLVDRYARRASRERRLRVWSLLYRARSRALDTRARAGHVARMQRWLLRRQARRLVRRMGRAVARLLPLRRTAARDVVRRSRRWWRLAGRIAPRWQRRWRMSKRRPGARRTAWTTSRRRALKRTRRRLRLARLRHRRRLRRRRRRILARRRRRHRAVRRAALLVRLRVVRAHRRVLRGMYLVARHALRRLLLPVHRPTTMRAFWRAASAAMAEWRPDVVHAHDLNTMPAARLTANLLGIPVIYDSHELWRHRNRHGEWRPVGRAVDALMERRLAPSADAVITVSPSIARWLERTYRLRRPVHVVRNTPHRRVQKPMSGLLGRRPGEQVVVYTGRFTSGRGLEDMIRALSGLPEHVVLVAVGYGDGDYVDSLLALARHQEVLHRVRLLDPVAPADVPAAIADGDLALVAIEPTCLSYRFALPNKLFEAVQAGVPVVASDLPDIADLVTRYGLGRRFRPGDARELAVAVAEVLADPGAARTATTRAADELCWEREVEQLLSCYRSLGFALPESVEIDLTAVPHQARSADRIAS